MGFTEELQRRRTFGIISHPDAGKTTLTEKLLLYGGAIQEAGAVKSNKIKKSSKTKSNKNNSHQLTPVKSNQTTSTQFKPNQIEPIRTI